MGLFNFFKKVKPVATVPPSRQYEAINTIGYPVQCSAFKEKAAIREELKERGKITDEIDVNQDMRNFIDDLAEAFSFDEEVTDATFGYLDTIEPSKTELVLAVGTNGESEAIEPIVGAIKAEYIPGTTMHLVSNRSNKKLYDGIKEINFSFYLKGQSQLLHQTLLKQWFSDSRKHRLLHALQKSKLFVFVENYNKKSNDIAFRFNYSGKEKWINLYTEKKMYEAMPMTGMPKNLSLVELEWQTIDEAAGKQINPKSYVINPHTVFEIRLVY